MADSPSECFVLKIFVSNFVTFEISTLFVWWFVLSHLFFLIFPIKTLFLLKKEGKKKKEKRKKKKKKRKKKERKKEEEMIK